MPGLKVCCPNAINISPPSLYHWFPVPSISISMATPLLIIAFSLLFTLSLSLPTFSPADNHLINCGSAMDTTVYNRLFMSDSPSANSNSPLLSATRTVELADQNPLPSNPQIYNTARAFARPSKYVFRVGDPGTHMVRLHFYPFVSSNLDLSRAEFHVLVDEYVVLSNFSGGNGIKGGGPPLVKEYFMCVHSSELVITFVPAKMGDFGFVNAIEVISAPKDLIADVGMLVNGVKDQKFNGLTRQALETVYRVNVGGPKVTPFNDTVWRTWIPDDGLFRYDDVSRKVYFSGRIQYQDGGASREVGPDFVYKTARVIVSTNASIPNVNMTWEFPVIKGYKYLVRLHFCDIASLALGLINFNVYVNGYLAYENVDLSSITYMLASPFYADFVAAADNSTTVRVDIGPSKNSVSSAIDGILNGVEIMKLNNSLGSLDGEMCSGMALKNWPRRRMGMLVPCVAIVCLLLSLYVVMHRRTARTRDPVAWTKLSTDVPEIRKQQLSAKV